MKRSNHKEKVGEKPIYSTCARCGIELPSKYAAKHHVCRENHS